MPAPALERLLGCTLLCVAACGFEHGALPPDGRVDAPPDVAVRPASCNAIKQATPSSTTGLYVIDPDGPTGTDAPFTVTCDMDTEGGGWTLVFIASSPNMSGPTSYTSSTPRLLADAQRALVAYRTSLLVPLPDYASFDLPASWRTQLPLRASATDLTIPVSMNGMPAAAATLRFGVESFNNYCSDAWDMQNTYGRFCIQNTAAPYFTGYATPANDACSSSLVGWASGGNCTNDKRFTIAVR